MGEDGPVMPSESLGKRRRRGQDSNLRTRFRVTDLANRRFRPLSHLSGVGSYVELF